jgi:hypothetical protein
MQVNIPPKSRLNFNGLHSITSQKANNFRIVYFRLKMVEWQKHVAARGIIDKEKKLRGLSLRANYTDRTTASCRRGHCQLLRTEGATCTIKICCEDGISMLLIHTRNRMQTPKIKKKVNLSVCSASHPACILVFLKVYFSKVSTYKDRLCGLVVRVLGYRSGGPGSIPGTTKKK